MRSMSLQLHKKLSVPCSVGYAVLILVATLQTRERLCRVLVLTLLAPAVGVALTVAPDIYVRVCSGNLCIYRTKKHVRGFE
jgi:hypothetical protein